MATEKVNESVVLKEPLPVIEVPPKNIVPVDQSSQKKSGEATDVTEESENDMDISMESGDVIVPDNKT